MTVLENMVYENIKYENNKNTNNIEILPKEYDYSSQNKLHIISVISNPCNYKRRITLMNEFIDRMENYGGLNKRNEKKEKNGYELYIVEMVYGDVPFSVTDSNNKRHLQLRTEHPLWHKENMINCGITKLLPKDWKYVAWIDSDIEFDSPHWVEDTKYNLYHKYDILQLFSTALDLGSDGCAMAMYQSFGYKFIEGRPYSFLRGTNYWHPGYAWACSREYFDCIGKLYEDDILGSADYRMAMALINKRCGDYSTEYKKYFNNWCDKIPGNIKLGYISGIIRHHYHGSKINRKYTERNEILRKYKYNPLLHIEHDSNGVIIPTNEFKYEFLEDILNYFRERKEDD